MIQVDRSMIPAPAVLNKKDRKTGQTESQRALAFFANRSAGFDFEAYRDAKPSLMRLFRKKCAYCESPGAGKLAFDVEHYRPKGKIKTPNKTLVPGYFWLASEWANLLLSCKDCNSAGKQEIAGGGKRTIGKANWFPLADERRRGRRPGTEASEVPLLLNPCDENPEDHLEFLADGAVLARVQGNRRSEKGETTIKVLGLDRLDLVDRRAETAVEVEADLTLLENAIEQLNEAPSNSRSRRSVKLLMKKISFHLDPRRDYLALRRTLVRRSFERMGLPVPKEIR
jgi:uncharacterized protein (TIGR02646 family)